MSAIHFDVLIVGGGLSGVCAGYNLQKLCPGKSYAILEGRATMGGTWDLFRYPGIRSDSDMFTLGYSFRPWLKGKTITDGDSILTYIKETAAANGIDQKIRFNHRVTSAAWSSSDAVWTVEAAVGPQQEISRFTCSFLMVCGGYYSYEEGYSPEFPGSERFKGTVVHPQKWPVDLAYAGKRVVVIGSGATAVTLVPAIAGAASHVTMLQRSPSYVIAAPDHDRMADFLRRYLPAKTAYAVVRWKNILFGIGFFAYCRSSPDRVKKFLLKGVQAALGPDYDVAKHFTPTYKPWDQRMCLVPNGDLFKAIKSNKASVVTDQIETFTETGIKLKSGAELAADVIVTATGLNLVALGGIHLRVDGQDIDPAKTLSYKGTMYSGVPNLASVFGYTNASWTLKCELTCEYLCRLINHMDRLGYRECVPLNNDASVTEEPFLNLSSGYVQRMTDKLPKQGSKMPWKLHQNYVLDLLSLKFGSVEDGVMRFLKPPPLSGGAH